MIDIIPSIILLLVLLNPFLIIVYLIDIVKKKTSKEFSRILIRAGIISFIVFSLFAILGDTIFKNVFNASFASFQIFGGIVFLLTVIICVSMIMLLKKLHDKIHEKKEELIEQYIDIAGRVIALLLGTVSIELIMSGLNFWINQKF